MLLAYEVHLFQILCLTYNNFVYKFHPIKSDKIQLSLKKMTLMCSKINMTLIYWITVVPNHVCFEEILQCVRCLSGTFWLLILLVLKTVLRKKKNSKKFSYFSIPSSILSFASLLMSSKGSESSVPIYYCITIFMIIDHVWTSGPGSIIISLYSLLCFN